MKPAVGSNNANQNHTIGCLGITKQRAFSGGKIHLKLASFDHLYRTRFVRLNSYVADHYFETSGVGMMKDEAASFARRMGARRGISPLYT